jgi:hypothetical protein
LKEKVGPKVQGKPERSARFALPAHKQHAAFFCISHVLATKQHEFLQIQLFQMLIVVKSSSATNGRRCIPLAFFKAINVL